MALKIDIVILSDPDYYPPTINAANILAERGHDVTLTGIRYPNAQRQQLHSAVKRIDYDVHTTGWRNVWQYISFYKWFSRHIKENKPDWILAYDSMAVGPVARAAKLYHVKWIFHNHDLLLQPKGWYKLIGWIEKKFAKRATVISFPQEDRAVGFAKETQLSSDPIIVYNGPRKNWSAIQKPVHAALQQWVSQNKFIVLYQGQFSKFFNLEILIKSLAALPDTFVLCMIGRELEKGMIDHYRDIINMHGLNDRVTMPASVSYDEVPSITRYCNIGVAKLGMDKNIPFNDYYLTGASNKISEYLTFGLPVLMANTEVNRSFYSNYGFAIFTDGNDSASIASALLRACTGNNYQQLHAAAAKAGNETFNFDIQFQKIVSILESR